MGSVKFGVSFHEYYDLKGVVCYAQRVEALGFDSLWITENVHSSAQALEPLITLSMFAAHTTRLTLGPAVLLLALRNPVGLAHAATTLDRLSGGRLVLGVGSGGEAPEGYQAYGIPIEERGQRCDEALEIIKRLWTEPSVTFSGKFSRFSGYTLGPRPLQKPHPPIWLGGNAPAVLRRVARWGDGFYPAHKSPAESAGLFDRVDAYRRQYRRENEEFTRSVYLFLNLAGSAQMAMDVTREVLQKRYGYPVSYLEPGANSLQGSPEDCVRLLKEYVAAGATHIVLDPTCREGDILSQLETVSEKILPHFK